MILFGLQSLKSRQCESRQNLPSYPSPAFHPMAHSASLTLTSNSFTVTHRSQPQAKPSKSIRTIKRPNHIPKATQSQFITHPMQEAKSKVPVPVPIQIISQHRETLFTDSTNLQSPHHTSGFKAKLKFSTNRTTRPGDLIKKLNRAKRV